MPCVCEHCGFEARTPAGLLFHKTKKICKVLKAEAESEESKSKVKSTFQDFKESLRKQPQQSKLRTLRSTTPKRSFATYSIPLVSSASVDTASPSRQSKRQRSIYVPETVERHRHVVTLSFCNDCFDRYKTKKGRFERFGGEAIQSVRCCKICGDTNELLWKMNNPGDFDDSEDDDDELP